MNPNTQLTGIKYLQREKHFYETDVHVSQTNGSLQTRSTDVATPTLSPVSRTVKGLKLELILKVISAQTS